MGVGGAEGGVVPVVDRKVDRGGTQGMAEGDWAKVEVDLAMEVDRERGGGDRATVEVS